MLLNCLFDVENVAPAGVCRVAYRPDLLAGVPAVRRSPLVPEVWDDPLAWQFGARVVYENDRRDWLEFAVRVAAGASVLEEARAALTRHCVMEAEIYVARPPLALAVIQELQEWNTRLERSRRKGKNPATEISRT